MLFLARCETTVREADGNNAEESAWPEPGPGPGPVSAMAKGSEGRHVSAGVIWQR